MSEEISVYQDANIHVTNLRAMLQGKTYAMANITSVSMHTQAANNAPGVIIAVIGGMIAMSLLAGRDAMGCGVFGLLLLAAGIAIALAAKSTYWVRIGSASGETNALSSNDRDYIQRIVNAMNEAIVRRG